MWKIGLLGWSTAQCFQKGDCWSAAIDKNEQMDIRIDSDNCWKRWGGLLATIGLVAVWETPGQTPAQTNPPGPGVKPPTLQLPPPPAPQAKPSNAAGAQSTTNAPQPLPATP